MNAVDHIAQKYFNGNITDFAAWLGEDRRVITNWRSRGRIPTDRMSKILRRSDDTQKGITPADFFPDRLPPAPTGAPATLEAAE